MATTVDERIVAAKFDASDFEKGVDKTIKKLDELKKNLSMKETSDAINDLSDKTEKATNSLGSSLEKLTDRFTTFTGMIKQNLLGGLAEQVAGVFLQMEQSVLNFVKSISTQQVSAGMDKYQQMLTSVRTMVSAGVGEDYAYAALDRIQTYTDETSYSMSQMTDAMSKMVAAGVNIEQAEKNVEGIANACANAGINAQDAGRAFYNLSQAFGSGYLYYTDYRSLELLNMTTLEFKQQMLEAAEAAGTLKQISDDTYQTINTNDKKVQAGKKVTVQNLKDSLKYNFMNTKAMSELFGDTYWMEIIDKEEIKKLREELGDAEFEERFGKIASTAYHAAREARSFTDVLNTLKDAVSTGWSKTFEHLFGKLEEAKNFFTDLTEGELANSIYRIASWRNAIFDIWNQVDINGNGMGGEVFRASILRITDALGILVQTFMDLFGIVDPEVKGNESVIQGFGDTLLYITDRFRKASLSIQEFALHFQEFMNSSVVEGGPTRIEIFRNAISTLGVVFGVLEKITSTVFSVFTRNEDTFLTLVDAFVTLIDSAGALLTTLNPMSEKLEEVIGFLGDIGAFFLGLTIDSATASLEFFTDILRLLVELFTNNSEDLKEGEGILDKMKESFEGIKAACESGLNAIKEFFGALLSDIRNLLGLGVDGEEGGFFENIAKFFETNEFVQNVKTWFTQAIADVQTFIKTIPEKLAKLPSLIITFIHGLFWKKDSKTGSAITSKDSEEVPTALKEWIDGAIEDVKEFISNIPNYLSSIPSMINEFMHGLFYEKTMRYNGSMLEETEVPTALNTWLKNAGDKAIEFIQAIPGKVTSFVANFGSVIGTFISELLWVHETDASGNRVKTDVPTELGKWLIGAGEAVRKFVLEDIPNAVVGLPSLLKEFIDSLLWKKDEDMSFFEKAKSMATGQRIPTALSEWLTGAGEAVRKFVLEDIPNAVVRLPSLIWNFIDGLLWKKDDDMSFFEKARNMATGERIPTALNEWLTGAGEAVRKFVLEDIPNAIIGLPSLVGNFIDGLLWKKDEDMSVFEKAKSMATGQRIPTELNTWASNAVDSIKSWITEKLPEYIANAPNVIANFIHNLIFDPVVNEEGQPTGEEVLSPLADWVVKAAASAIDFITNDLPKFVMKVPSLVNSFINEIIKSPEQRDIDNKKREVAKNCAEAVGNVNISQIVTRSIVGGENAKEDTEEAFQPIIDGLQYGENILMQNIHTFNKDIKARSEKEGSEEGEDVGFSFVDSIVNGLKEGLKTIGPAILDAIIWVIDNLAKVGEWITDALNGKTSIAEVIGDAVGDDKNGENPMKEKLIQLGESLSSFFLDTIPVLIGSAVGALIKEMPTWFNKLFDAMNKSMNEAGDESGLTDGTAGGHDFDIVPETIIGFVENFVTKITQFATSDTGTVIAMIITLSILLGKIKDLFSIADELEESAEILKWTAITVAVSAIAGIMSYISNLTMNGTDAQVKHFEDIIDKIGSLMEKIMWIVGLFTLKDFIGLFDGSGKTVFKNNGNVSIFNGGSDGFLSKIASGFGGMLESFLAVVGVGAGIDAAGNLAGAGIDSFLTTITDSFSDMSVGVTEAFSELVPFVDSLSAMNDKISDAILTVQELGTLFGTLYEVLDNVYINTHAEDMAARSGISLEEAKTILALNHKDISATDEFITELQNRLDASIKLADFIRKIGSAFKDIDSIEDLSGAINKIKVVIGNGELSGLLTDLLTEVDRAYNKTNLSHSFFQFGDEETMTGITSAMEILSSGLSIFSAGISDLSSEKIQALRDSLTLFRDLARAVDDAKDFDVLSSVGREIKQFGSGMQGFFDEIKDLTGFNENEYAETKRKMDTILDLAQGMALAAKEMNAYGTEFHLIAELGAQMDGFGTSVGQFMTSLKNALPANLSKDDSEILYSITGAFGSLLGGLHDLSQLLLTYSAVDITQKIEEIFKGLSEGKTKDRLAQSISWITGSLAEIIKLSGAGTDIALALKESVENAFNSDTTGKIQPEIKLKPVVTFDQAYLNQQLSGAMDLNGGMISLDMNALVDSVFGANSTTEAAVNSINTKLDMLTTINDSINAIPQNVATAGDLASAFGGMAIVFDTGALAGSIYNQVDDMINQKIVLITRGNAVVGLGP